MRFLKGERRHIQRQLIKISEMPMFADEGMSASIHHMEQLKNIIFVQISKSILSVDKSIIIPLDGFDLNLIPLVSPILNVYCVSFGLSQYCNEKQTNELHLHFPTEKLTVKNKLPEYENKVYADWLNNFLHEANQMVIKFHKAVEDDFQLLKQQLLDVVQNGADEVCIQISPVMLHGIVFGHLLIKIILDFCVVTNTIKLERYKPFFCPFF